MNEHVEMVEQLAPCQYMDLRDDLICIDEAATRLGISIDELREYCRLELVPHARIGRGLRFLKSRLEGVTAEALDTAHREHKKAFISEIKYRPHVAGARVEDCKILAYRNRLHWTAVRRLLISSELTGQNIGRAWFADTLTFNEECNKLGRDAFTIGQTKCTPCTATPVQRKRMLRKQQGLCACCGDMPAKLLVDHDHDTGAMREGLCHYCNAGIGHFRDDPARLEKAAAYLRRHGR